MWLHPKNVRICPTVLFSYILFLSCWLFLSFLIMFTSDIFFYGFAIFLTNPSWLYLISKTVHVHTDIYTHMTRKLKDETNVNGSTTTLTTIENERNGKWYLSLLCHSLRIYFFSLYEHLLCFCKFISIFTDWCIMHEYVFPAGWFFLLLLFCIFFFCEFVINWDLLNSILIHYPGFLMIFLPNNRFYISKAKILLWMWWNCNASVFTISHICF